MLIQDLIGSSVGLGVREVQTIKRECSQFLLDAANTPLLKSLPSSYPNFHKVKVRLHKKRDAVADVFERAFGHEFANLRQRAVFAYPEVQVMPEGYESYYVFPVDGYKFLYSKEVTNSGAEYRHVVDTLFESFEDTTKASEVVADLLKYTYSANDLLEGLNACAEIILYGIPYYYAVKQSACKGYDALLSMAK